MIAETHAEPALWITDAELIRRLGAPEKIARQAIRALDTNPRSGFPQKQALWGHRRYWPAVKSYFDAINGGVGAARLIPENRVPHSAAAPSKMRTLTRRAHG